MRVLVRRFWVEHHVYVIPGPLQSVTGCSRGHGSTYLWVPSLGFLSYSWGYLRNVIPRDDGRVSRKPVCTMLKGHRMVFNDHGTEWVSHGSPATIAVSKIETCTMPRTLVGPGKQSIQPGSGVVGCLVSIVRDGVKQLQPSHPQGRFLPIAAILGWGLSFSFAYR